MSTRVALNNNVKIQKKLNITANKIAAHMYFMQKKDGWRMEWRERR